VDNGLLAGRSANSSLCAFMPQEARYVRVRLDVPAAAGMPGIYEVGLHAAAAQDARRADAGPHAPVRQ